MISRLHGILIEKSPPQLVIDVKGVGYEIFAPMSTFYQLAGVGQEVCVFTHLVVREDAHQLYGFAKAEERSLFRHLIRINGVGPKLALTILSGMEPNNFVQCVMDNNIVGLTRLPGIGKKTAERLLVEMRDRLEHWQPVTAPSAVSSTTQEAISALISLGYKPNEASRAISRINQANASSEQLIRLALQALACE